MRILLVEDNSKIAQNIQDFFALEGISLDWAADGEAGWKMFEHYSYDLLIIDWMLPKLDGIALCHKIRKTSAIPMIMLTAKGEIGDKLEGFESGFDDYLVKPFDLEELLARVSALYKRTVGEFEEFSYQDITVNLQNRVILKAGEIVKLTIKEFYLLEYLIRHRGLPVSRSDLLEYVWGEESLFENSNKLDVYIANIRRKTDPKMIQTIKGFGYRIAK